MKKTCLLLVLLIAFSSNAQKCINYEVDEKGVIELTKEIKIPKIKSGYTLWLPDTDALGMVIFFNSRRDTIKREFIIDYSIENKLAVLYLTTENQVEFLFEKNKMLQLEKLMKSVMDEHLIPSNNLLFCGMSLAGTRAVKQAIFASDSLSQYNIEAKAIAICDAPLDMIRFHKEAVKAGLLEFHPLAANEGKWVSLYLEKELGGRPRDQIEAYIEYSPYSYVAGNKNLSQLKNVAIRAYTEPDIDWWIENRRKDYYGMNAVDLAALINELKILGNENASLIATEGKGYHPDGKRHPHSWSIVDEKALIDWFINLEE